MVTNPATVVHEANDVLNSTNDALQYDTIRYDTIEEFIVDSKAEYTA